MTKIMVLGDTHGNTDVAVMAVQNAGVLDIKVIIQCGDFGLWDHFKDGIDYLDILNAELMDNDVTLIWVDGNHENFDRLEWYHKNNPKNKWGQVFIRSNILWTPRGCKWKMDNKMFMSVGGAVSVDKDWRQMQQSKHNKVNWWPQEQLTEAELEQILRNHANSPCDVDFLFTHDCPTNAPFRGRMKNDQESQIHRQRMDRLGKAISPNMWFHGHMHTKYDGYDFPAYEPTTTVYGLECDGMRWNWGVLDTEFYTFEWGHKLFPIWADETEDALPKGVEGDWVAWEDDGWMERYGYGDEEFDVILPD